MKKITTMLFAAFFGLVSIAAAAPTVTVTNSSNFEIEINNRTYSSSDRYTIPNLPQGNYTVSVYEVTGNGIFGIGKQRNLISSRQFALRNSDVQVNVNRNGSVQVSQSGYNNNNSRANNDRRYENNSYENDRKYGKSEGKGNGNKYGHYKNKDIKNKKSCDDRNDDKYKKGKKDDKNRSRKG